MRTRLNQLLRNFNRFRLCEPRNFNSGGYPLLKQSKTMATSAIETQLTLFEGRPDRFDGITVHSKHENCPIDKFPTKLDESLKAWRDSSKRGIWFKVDLDHSEWVPILTKRGFRFHHAKDDFVMMYNWLPQHETSNIPPYSHTMIGVGAVVVNDKDQLLVVREKYYLQPHWKLPGGYVEPGENLVDAAIREVWEETKIETEFQTLLTIRQTHHGMFGCSDIYTVVSLKPLTEKIEKCEREIAQSEWMDLNEFLNHPDVHELNRFFVQKFVEYRDKKIKMDWRHGIHQVLNKPYTVYYLSTEDEETAGT